jgi:hypothetical protein
MKINKTAQVFFVIMIGAASFLLIRNIPRIEAEFKAARIIHSYMQANGIETEPGTKEYKIFMRQIVWNEHPELAEIGTEYIHNQEELEAVRAYAWKYSGYKKLYGGNQEPEVEEAKAPPSPEPTSLPRWKIYETALAKAIVNSKDALCEWEIWGVSGREVYVWAQCVVKGPIGTAGSVPAVITLGENGEILKIETPDDGTGYGPSIRKLFPLDVQNKIFSHQFDAPAAGDHIDERMRTNGPPLIAISGTLLP